MDVIYSVIKSVVIFLLLTKILELLMPDGNMKKYMRLFSGIVLMLIMLGPIIKYSGLLPHMNFEIIKKEFEISSMGEGIDYGDYATLREDMTLNIYKDKLAKHIESLLISDDIHVKKTRVLVEEDTQSDTYGMIKEVYLTIGQEKADEHVEKSHVDIVKIDRVAIGEQQSEMTVKSADAIMMEKKIKKIMKNFYNLSSDNIHITIETC
ncbi:stage III sporulation protein AF [Vallitalea pronyensis]|uniref:Stage III sporulation protein AF n=1 Tax=Vallitalea pronyensis TaxID=1348613 RepID=A0A8J8MM35_9FIRM|nr:stage III sporulation protein AF [Vallitalea pronyensis]QUI23808.1 stage III sporulation protein AF [Vallitalea pronyensis]